MPGPSSQGVDRSRGRGIRLVATDSYRLAMRDIEGSDALTDASQILVPARALAELQRLSALGSTPKEDGDGGAEAPKVGLSIGEHDVTFAAGNVKVSTRLLDGVTRTIASSFRLSTRTGSTWEGLALGRLTTGTTSGAGQHHTGPFVHAWWGVDLTVVSQEVGDASETVDADFEGTDLTIAFNPTYLIDGVEAVSGDEVLLETVDATKPATVRAAEETNFHYC